MRRAPSREPHVTSFHPFGTWLLLAGLLVPGALACTTVRGEIRELEADDAEDRREALAALGEMLERGVSDEERARIIEALHRSLGDNNSVIRMIAAGVLGSSGDGASIPLLVPLLQDRSWGVRHAAVLALRALEAKDQGPAIARVLREDPKSVCRLEAAKTLRDFRSEEGVEACIAAITTRESDAGVRNAAWEALKAISAEDLPQRPEVWRTWWADFQAAKATPVPPPDGEGG